MALLGIHNCSMGFGGALLFDRISLQIEPDERACIVGRNGEGKTTLLNIIKGNITPDDGDIFCQPGLKIALLEQEIPSDLKGTVYDIVSGKSERLETNNRGEDEENREQETNAKITLTQLQLEPDHEFSILSAGMKRRVLLAKALAGSPDILLLDEPTNHMDIASIALIEDILLKFSGTILFVTHDRIFLRKIATRIIEIDRAAVTSWSCGYDMYLQRKDALLTTEAIQNKKFDKKLSNEEEWIRSGIKARRVRNEGRVRALLKLRDERRNRRNLSGNANMQLQEAERSGKLVIKAKGISYDYDNDSIVRDFSVTIMRGDRIGIIGPNGSGKTTLLGLLLKKLAPDKGSIRHGANLELSYFDQTREQLDEEKSVQDNVADGTDMLTINGKKKHVIGYLKDFLFSPDRARSPVKTLSGGERNRLLLARLFTRPSNVLVMDEPTNDLDTQTLELLEDLLMEYSGTLLLVSHDRAFLNNVVTSTLVFEGNQKVSEYIGGYDDWFCQKKEDSVSKKKIQKIQKKITPASDVQTRKLGYMEKLEIESLPETIESMEKELEDLFSVMSAPDYYKKDGTDIAKEKARHEELETLLNAAYARWEELENIGQLK